MCIVDDLYYDVSGRVRSVRDTRILVARCRDGASQLTVYANRVELGAGAPVAMILPVPCGDGEEARVRMVDTSADPGGKLLWDALEELFEEDEVSMGFGMDDDCAANNSRARLPVLRCGSYEYSVVPGVDDFGRLDPRLGAGAPSAGVMALLRERYARGFAFMVCKLAGAAAYHPIAYTHPLQRAQDGAQLFVPTLHWHGGERPEAPGAIEWDHAVYVLGAREDEGFGARAPCGDAQAARLRWKLPTCYGEHLPDGLTAAAMRWAEIRGRGARANEDILVRA